MNAGHRVRAEIDLSALRHNVGVIRRAAGPRRVMAVVKANAYGLGAVPVAAQALAAGCSALAVNDAGEGVELREAGIAAPVLILGALLPEDVPAVVEHDLTVSAHSEDLLGELDAEAARRHRPVKVHLKIDTGMTRLGVPIGRAPAVARAIAGCRNLVFEAVFTHLTSSVSGHSGVTHDQLERFERALAELGGAGLRPPLVHAANSAGLFAVPESRYDMVRPGISLYGMDPGLFASLGLDLKPVLSVRTRVACLHAAPAGTTIGYEQTHRVARDTVIATCPIGYEDGYPWQLSNRGTVLIRGRRAPVVGRVSMNFITVDAGEVPDVSVGDEVTVVGRDGGEEIRVESLARAIGTIPYELTCRLGRRVRRDYVGQETAERSSLAASLLRRAAAL